MKKAALKICTLIVLFSMVQSDNESLSCYECGTEVPEEPDCQEFRFSGVWLKFKKECGKNMMCVKSTNYENKEIRGCTPRKSLSGFEHDEGCFAYETSGTMFCYCKTDFCNTGVETKINTNILLFHFILVILILVLS